MISDTERYARKLFAVYAAARKHFDPSNSPGSFESMTEAKRVGWIAAATTARADGAEHVAHDVEAAPTPAAPVPMILTCPACSARHVDVGDFATKIHHTHSCQTCGLTWRPAIVATVGVQFLPGFKNP